MHLRQIWTIGKVTFKENLRKQLLQVILILTIAAIASTTLLSFFDMGVQVKILKDLSLAAILFSGGILAIAVSVGSIPAELQSRTAYPTLSRAVRRSDYILGKYLGICLTSLLCMGLIGLVFLGILAVYEHQFDTAVALGMGYVFLEVCLLAAVGMFFSLLVSPMVSATLSLFVFILGQMKIGYLHAAIENSHVPVATQVLQAVYYLLPNLDSFSFKDALIHNIAIPSSYLALVAAYAVVYTGFVLAVSSAVFSRREI
ncbi:MAG: ABC transporter permease [Armatimonadetes bacterium]|nr:ABC transporter permease [Armatimonadota bacterium]